MPSRLCSAYQSCRLAGGTSDAIAVDWYTSANRATHAIHVEQEFLLHLDICDADRPALLVSCIARSPSSPSRVEIPQRIRCTNERVPMRPAGGESRLKTAIDYQPRNNCVSQPP